MGEPGPLPALPLLLRLGVHATAKRLMGSLEAEMETCRVFTFMVVHIHGTCIDLLFCALGNTLVELGNAFTSSRITYTHIPLSDAPGVIIRLSLFL